MVAPPATEVDYSWELLFFKGTGGDKTPTENALMLKAKCLKVKKKRGESKTKTKRSKLHSTKLPWDRPFPVSLYAAAKKILTRTSVCSPEQGDQYC
jgi:hypothetical protein